MAICFPWGRCSCLTDILINSHPAWYRRTIFLLLRQVWHFHCRLLRIIVDFPARNVGPETLREIEGAHNGIGCRQQDQDNSEHSESCERFSDGQVLLESGWVVHPDQFEDEIGQSSNVKELEERDGQSRASYYESVSCKTHNDYDHARSAFPPSENTSQYQNDDGDWNGRNRQVELNTPMLSNNDDELDGESNEEEEIKLEQGNINLSGVSLRNPNDTQSLCNT